MLNDINFEIFCTIAKVNVSNVTILEINSLCSSQLVFITSIMYVITKTNRLFSYDKVFY